MVRDEAAPEWLPWKSETRGTWLQLQDSAWINMGNVNAIFPLPGGALQLLFVGQHDISHNAPYVVCSAQDIALIRSYLAGVRFFPNVADPFEAAPTGAVAAQESAQHCGPAIGGIEQAGCGLA